MNKRPTYHHGDLRATLVTQGLRLLETDGVASLSLRALAKEVGVSPNAPYRHFADKGDLMAALAAEGFLQFADAIVAAPMGPPREALRAQGRAYLEFAFARPALYRLMFSPYGYSLTSDTCQREAGRAFGSLVETAARAQATGWQPDRPLVDAVLAFWSALHGWATLVGDRLVPPSVELPDHERILDTILGPSSAI